MTTANITRRQSPARDPIGWLLLTGIEYTNARPWFGFVGAVVTLSIFAVIKWRWL